MNSNDVGEQLGQYISELLKIEELISRQQNSQQHLHVLLEKIRMKSSQFNNALQQLSMK